jgi:RNA polymerase sigma-70 factor (ECF subfamily)
MQPTTSPEAPTATRHDATDEQLVALALVDSSHFAPLMRRHNQRLFRLTRAMLGDADEAEDAVQQAYVSAYGALANFQATGSFSAWMTRIARNEALSRLRRRKVRNEIALEPGTEDDVMALHHDESASPEQITDARRLASLAERAIDGLPEIYRVVFVLRELEGLDTLETASTLSVTEEVVKVRLHRARNHLRVALREGVEASALDTYVFLGERCDRIVARVMEAIGVASS